MDKPVTLHLQLAIKDYGAKETQRLRSDITSIVTVEVTSTLMDSDKRMVKDAILHAVKTSM